MSDCAHVSLREKKNPIWTDWFERLCMCVLAMMGQRYRYRDGLDPSWPRKKPPIDRQTRSVIRDSLALETFILKLVGYWDWSIGRSIFLSALISDDQPHQSSRHHLRTPSRPHVRTPSRPHVRTPAPLCTNPSRTNPITLPLTNTIMSPSTNLIVTMYRYVLRIAIR